MDEQELAKTCHDLGYGNISREVICHNRSIRAKKRRERTRKHFVILKLDDFVGFIVDAFVAQLIVACRKKLQVITKQLS